MAEVLIIKKLSEHATIPTRATPESAGADLYSAYDYVIKPRSKQLCKTDLQMICPPGSYARIAPKSGLTHHNFIDAGAGVVDPDYRGNVGVILFNFSARDFVIKRGDPIAQLIIERIFLPEIRETHTPLDETQRNASGFGVQWNL